MRINIIQTVGVFMACSTFILSSCSNNFLDSEPMTQKVNTNYYKTPKDAFETLIGCYNNLPGGYGDFFLIANIASDECYGGGGYTDAYGNQVWDEWKDYNDLQINQYTWNGRFFKAIRRCHILCEILDQIDWGEDISLRTRYEAEARMLRAHYIFELQRNFGHIPLIKSSLDELPAQTDPDEVYRYIIEDLKFAIENLPNTSFLNTPESEFGRMTRWAAEGYIARVYLFYTGYYGKSEAPGLTKQETISYLEDCIKNSGHSLVPRYGALWPWSMRKEYHKDPTLTYAGEYNPEILMCIRHSVLRSNGLHQYIGMRGEPYAGAYAPFYSGWGMGTITPKCFNQFAEGDTRRFASIIDLKAENIPNDGTDQREFTGYCQKKYQVLTDPDDPTSSYPLSIGASGARKDPQDQILMRYSDILLMAAELELETNIGNSQKYLDEVRDRAFGDKDHRIAATAQSIFDERGYEFVFEGIRYYDVLRQGLTKAKEILDVKDAPVLNGKNPALKNIEFSIEKAGLLRIPEDQIRISEGKLVQNPGWD
ncbi:RagB/SusD family nutrient uptake outer membrane protein [Bacteroides uniformis]|uniref:RagB/SusD family nutrient uptake outer membrane protein n=1 Tax=Bacteroides uniformis TaxID=820 RepID=UPI00189AEA9B|nr:RagB/SusD family nutrient uptake outer membrane protein [Bacteroides uniformis]